MDLVWRGDDGFDERGTRVASVARFRDFVAELGHGPWYWNAFVAHEYVLVGDAPGRWPTAAEARVAATARYQYLRERSDGPLLPPSDAREPVPWRTKIAWALPWNWWP